MSKKSSRKLLPLTTALVLTLTLLFALASPVFAQNTEYVDDDGVCGGNSPCHTTIQAAITAATNGETIIVYPGTYNEKLTIGKDNLVIQSLSGPAATIIDLPDSDAPGGVFITGDGNTFEGFTVRDFSDTTYESKIIRIHYDVESADNNVVRNNVIQGNLNQGGVTNQTDYGVLVYGIGNLIESNEIYDIGYMGVNIVGPPHSLAEGTTVRGNNVHHIGIYAIGMDRSGGNTVTGNTIANLTGGTLWGTYYDPADYTWGIIVWGENADGNQIVDQDVTGLPNGGIVLSSAHNTDVTGCNISGNADTGLSVVVSSWAGGIPTGNTVVGNNISDNGEEGVVIGDGVGANNVFHCNGILGNTDFGMENLGTLVIDAEDNWWGDDTGPYHSILNPTGLGDVVSSYVDFDPWLLQGCLDFTKSAAPSQVMLDGVVTFTIEVTNNCICSFADVVVEDLVPVGLTILDVTVSPEALVVVDGQLVTVELGTLDPGDSYTITIQVRADAPGPFENVAYLTSIFPMLEAWAAVVIVGVEFVPEVGTLALLGTGLAGLAGYAGLRWRTRRR
jgi:uncharacterized repeat protein (TIGR01451 family)